MTNASHQQMFPFLGMFFPAPLEGWASNVSRPPMSPGLQCLFLTKPPMSPKNLQCRGLQCQSLQCLNLQCHSTESECVPFSSPYCIQQGWEYKIFKFQKHLKSILFDVQYFNSQIPKMTSLKINAF